MDAFAFILCVLFHFICNKIKLTMKEKPISIGDRVYDTFQMESGIVKSISKDRMVATVFFDEFIETNEHLGETIVLTDNLEPFNEYRENN
jgi:hypothetical protein